VFTIGAAGWFMGSVLTGSVFRSTILLSASLILSSALAIFSSASLSLFS